MENGEAIEGNRSDRGTSLGITNPNPEGLKRRLSFATFFCFLVDLRCLPAFLPCVTWERMMRLSDRPIPLGLWSMNWSAMVTVIVSCYSRSISSNPGDAFSGLPGFRDSDSAAHSTESAVG